jgi:hypothetical protein
LAPSLILCLRHAEKPANAEDDSEEPDANGPGFDQHGSTSRHGLTIKGWQRACALATTRFAGQLARNHNPGVCEQRVAGTRSGRERAMVSRR